MAGVHPLQVGQPYADTTMVGILAGEVWSGQRLGVFGPAASMHAHVRFVQIICGLYSDSLGA